MNHGRGRSLQAVISWSCHTADVWYNGYDEETVVRVMKALKTVRIGDVSAKATGASGRRIYDFVDPETGEPVDFTFFKDTFFYKMGA